MKNVLVTGSFDLLHSGHIAFLKEASQYGKVYVGIGMDKSIEFLKGRKTVCSQDERLFMIKAIRYVEDAWINQGMGIMDFDDCMSKGIRFDIILVNEDQDIWEKREFAYKHNMEYVVLKRKPAEGLPWRSSTSIRNL